MEPEDVDIYEDLFFDDKGNASSCVNFGMNDASIFEDHQNKWLAEKTKLEKEIEDSRMVIEKCNKVNAILKANISSLYKTAKAEITRKDDMISELRKKLDDIIFRRNQSQCSKQPSRDCICQMENSPRSYKRRRWDSQSKSNREEMDRGVSDSGQTRSRIIAI